VDPVITKKIAEKEIKELDELAYKLLSPSSVTNWDEIRRKLPKIMKTWKELACRNCDWICVCKTNEEWLKY